MTEDLLEKVQKNMVLSKRLGDPRFMQAVTEFQTDPKAAMAKYQSNPEIQLFLKEFCGILGTVHRRQCGSESLEDRMCDCKFYFTHGYKSADYHCKLG